MRGKHSFSTVLSTKSVDNSAREFLCVVRIALYWQLCGSSYASEERLLSELRRLRQIDADA